MASLLYMLLINYKKGCDTIGLTYMQSLSRRHPLSRFLAKTLKVNKIPMKSFSKNLLFGIDFKLLIPPLIYKINSHSISGMRT